MNKILKVKFENCFGIGELNQDFKFTSSEKAQLIYAPNGTMKSSFANIFDLVSKDKTDEIKDRVFLDKVPVCEILINNESINKDEIVVVNAETIASDKSITKFIARTELKNRYDEIYNELLEEKNKFITILKKQSRSTDCDTELQAIYSEGENFFDFLVRVENSLNSNFDHYNFKYNDIFDKAGKVKSFLQKNKVLLDEYILRYTHLLEQSKFFKKSNNSFGTTQASTLLASVNDNSFFEVGHHIALNSNKLIGSKDDLSKLIQEELQAIINDEELLKKFDKVDKALGKNAELKTFKALLEKDQTILLELNDYEGFRKKIWLSHISALKANVKVVLDLYKSRKLELEDIIKSANNDIEKWNSTIEIFNSRFYVPFNISLENQSDIILKEEVPKLKFTYKGNSIINNDEKVLLDILSRGESRAYYILRFLFEIQSRIENNEKLIIIFDDVADSFDYKNKYAIIEYIKDILESRNVNAIILTHNFDFYRTVAKRLAIKSTSFIASKCSQGIVKINKGKYFEDVFKSIFINKYDQEKNFIGLIPFVRNLFEYLVDEDSYNFLTSCLHIKANTKDITVEDVHSILKKVVVSKSEVDLPFKGEKLLDLLFKQTEIIVQDYSEHSIDLEDKLIVAIACRLKAELYMIKNLPAERVESINKNQTQALYQMCKESGLDATILKLLNRVNLITPEHLHVNSFMFEPLVDMSMNNLIDLYQKLSSLEIPEALVA